MIEYTVKVDNGTKEWYMNEKLHREDGPAIEHHDGTKEWYLNGGRYSEREFLKRTQPAKELSIAEIEALLGYKIKVVK